MWRHVTTSLECCLVTEYFYFNCTALDHHGIGMWRCVPAILNLKILSFYSCCFSSGQVMRTSCSYGSKKCPANNVESMECACPAGTGYSCWLKWSGCSESRSWIYRSKAISLTHHTVMYLCFVLLLSLLSLLLLLFILLPFLWLTVDNPQVSQDTLAGPLQQQLPSWRGSFAVCNSIWGRGGPLSQQYLAVVPHQCLGVDCAGGSPDHCPAELWGSEYQWNWKAHTQTEQGISC